MADTKRKQGRPPIGGSDRVNVLITPELRKQLKEYTAETGASDAGVVRLALERFLNAWDASKPKGKK